ncbi:MAG: prepilin-type N-terminal cleavage/methylation domain-containing protein [Mariprofundaceae bacterium]
MRNRRREAGFTMIELMFALLVASVGMLAMVSMLDTDMRSNQTSEHRMDASGISQSILQQAIAQASVATNSYATNTFAVANLPGGQATVTVTPSPATVTGPTHVRVELSWQARGVKKQVELRGRTVTQ